MSSPHPPASRDHGGNLDSAVAAFGGARAEWLDLSTGINPVPYAIPELSDGDWTRLPDADAQAGLVAAARTFWKVPAGAAVLALPGASSAIARSPDLAAAGTVCIGRPTYNEHEAAFAQAGWTVTDRPDSDARVLVHPNNPDGRRYTARDITSPLTIIDESFCDVCPDASLMSQAETPGVVILKSFGKFWGLAGLRLGFAIGDPHLVDRLAQMLGPWPVSGPALRIGTAALRDDRWATVTRARLAKDRDWLDACMRRAGAQVVGGTDLFGLYDVGDAQAMQTHLARSHIWSRIFPYSDTLIRLGLPAPHQRQQLEHAL